ncbi:MAG: 6-phosphogluconolactonase [Bacteroidetes bacterium]|nr:6-phosphogluconolactonase [Bacteroidota bacterium]
MPTKGSIKVFESDNALATGVADFIISDAQAAIAGHGQYSLVLSGGNTPESLFRMLAAPPYATALDWSRVHIFWGDERAVPLDDERNNAHVAISLWLRQISIPPGNIHRIPSDMPAQEAAREYEQTIKRYFAGGEIAFDLVLLGLGPDGHTASLFPHSPLLEEKDAIVTAGFIPAQNMERITMTITLINEAHKVLFLVAGKAKATILQHVIQDAPAHDTYPAKMINPRSGGLYWFIDRAAAARLL